MAVPIRARLLVLLTALIVWAPASLLAQDPPELDAGLAPPHLSFVDGPARLERGDQGFEASEGQILAVGDRLRTAAGWVEVLFGDGSVLHVDARSTIDLLDEWLVRLIDGRVFLHVVTPADDLGPIEYRIDTPAVSFRALDAGEFRIASVDYPRIVTEVAVARGVAELTTGHGTVAIHAGERIRTAAGEPSGTAFMYNAAAWDDFDRWSYNRRHAWAGDYATHLPRQLAPYGSTLSRHGSWAHHPTYGAVWYPRVVADWRPYYYGQWSVLSPYGWTWVGTDPWAWPTHYYGSWGVLHDRWFWIPGGVWAPARVHWFVSTGFVAWVPFGFNVSVFPHVAWTVVPRHVFHVNVIVPRHSVRVHTLRADVRHSFVRQAPPVPGNTAVPRASIVQRAAGRTLPPSQRTAVPRDSASAGSTARSGSAVRRAPSANAQVSTDANTRGSVGRAPSSDREAGPGALTTRDATRRSPSGRAVGAQEPTSAEGSSSTITRQTPQGATRRAPSGTQSGSASTSQPAGRVDAPRAAPRAAGRAPATADTNDARPGATRRAPSSSTPPSSVEPQPSQPAGTSRAVPRGATRAPAPSSNEVTPGASRRAAPMATPAPSANAPTSRTDAPRTAPRSITRAPASQSSQRPQAMEVPGVAPRGVAGSAPIAPSRTARSAPVPRSSGGMAPPAPATEPRARPMSGGSRAPETRSSAPGPGPSSGRSSTAAATPRAASRAPSASSPGTARSAPAQRSSGGGNSGRTARSR
jgi:hypothetical protein